MASQANNGWTWSQAHNDWYRTELQSDGTWSYIFSKHERGRADNEEEEEPEQPLEPGQQDIYDAPTSGAVGDVVSGMASMSVSGQRQGSRRQASTRSSRDARSRGDEVVASSSGRVEYKLTTGRNEPPVLQQASQPYQLPQGIPLQSTIQQSFGYTTTPVQWAAAPSYTSHSAGVSSNQMGKQPVQGYAPQAGYPGTSQYLQPYGNLAIRDPGPVLSEPDEELTTDDGHSPKWLRGTEGNFETLDPAFRKVKDHWNFYVPGRVFATLWWEPMGEQDPEQGPHLGPSVVRYGERAYAKVRRFIVVHAKPKDYYSKCIQISTHGGRGTTKKGLNQTEHCIVYTGDTPPKKLEGEKKLRKDPIQVRPVDPSEKLDPLSRANLAKTYPVEMNLKVKEIGKVSEKHLKKLIAYWKELK